MSRSRHADEGEPRKHIGRARTVLVGALVVALLLLGVSLLFDLDGSVWPRVVGLTIAALLWFATWRQLTVSWRYADTPTVPVKGAAVGRCEVNGRIRSVTPLISRFTRQPVVWCSWSIQQFRKVGDYSAWEEIEGATDVAPDAYVFDDTGSIWVDLERARVRLGDSQQYVEELPDMVPRTRYVEDVLAADTPVYVMGDAQHRGATLQLTSDQATPLLVTADSERTEHRSSTSNQRLMMAAGLAFGVAAMMLNIQVGDPHQSVYSVSWSNWWLALGVMALYLGSFGVLYAVRQYNRLVDVRNRVERAWSLITVQLARRSALIPQLVEVVRGYGEHEAAIHRDVGVRWDVTRLPDAGDLARANEVAAAQRQTLATLFALAERYPELRASEKFGALQIALEDTENRIAFARAFYNDSVMVWRDRSRVFPWSLMAPLVRGPVLEYIVLDRPDSAGTDQTDVQALGGRPRE